MLDTADIGIFGGSGFYSFINSLKEISIDTPYGNTSSKITIAEYKGKKLAFLPRHGKDHSIPPHLINYRANIYAMKMLGVKKIIAPNSSGSLKESIKPGDFVVCDQFIDRTNGRADTFFEGPDVRHTSAAHPYCPDLREKCIAAGKESGLVIHDKGTVVVINGPRFSTMAESRWYSKMGWDVINMTQYPEGYLSRELGICYANIALVTDYDAGLEGNENIKPVTHNDVLDVFNKNIDNVKKVVLKVIEKIDINDGECNCCKG